jgi:hypothetical protein
MEIDTMEKPHSLVVKILFQDIVRRVTIEAHWTVNIYQQIKSWIENLFENVPENWLLQYLDDEGGELNCFLRRLDLISINTDIEFQEALMILQKMNVPSLKFVLVGKSLKENSLSEELKTSDATTEAQPKRKRNFQNEVL